MLSPENSKSSCFLRSFLVILLISGLFVSLLSCKKSEKVAGPREKVTIAYSTASNAVLVYIAFANCYITKPIDIKQFLHVVQSIEEFWLSIVVLPNGEKK